MIKSIIASQIAKDKVRFTARLARNIKRTDAGCIEWAGRVNNDGYARINFRHQGRHLQVYAHRLFWVLHTGKAIPSNLVLDHKCRNRRCCNPAHLQLVAPETNSKLAHRRKERFG